MFICPHNSRYNFPYHYASEKRARVSNGLKRQQNNTIKRIKRENESEEQKQSRLLQNRTATGAARATESVEHKQSRLLQNRTATVATRNKKCNNITRIAFSTTECSNQASLGANSMTEICNFCNAK